MSTADFAAAHPEIHARIEPKVLISPVVVRRDPVRIAGDLLLDHGQQLAGAGTLVFLDGLEVSGNLLNLDLDGGATLIVIGKTRAQNIVAGGSFIYLDEAVVPGFLLGHYNHGMIEARTFVGDLAMSLDHDVYLGRRRDRDYVRIDDFPIAGREVAVDGIRLDLPTQFQAQAEAFANWFGNGRFTDLAAYPPADREDAMLEDDYEIEWFDWAMTSIRAGAPTRDDTFARFAAHMRAAFERAAKAC